MSKKLSLIIFLGLFGCSTIGIKTHDLSQLKVGKKYESVIDITSEKSLYELEYLIEQDIFRYQTLFVSDSYRYIEVLYRNNILLAYSAISYAEAAWPEIRKCTLFPPHDDLNVTQCLSDLNNSILTRHNNEMSQIASILDDKEREKVNDGKYETIGAAVILSPIVIPVAIIMSPFLIYDTVDENSTIDNFRYKLGDDYSKLQPLINTIPSDEIHVSNGSGSFYVNAGSMDSPAIAVGIENNKIIWIQKDPIWLCGGGFIFWGMKCIVGDHDDEKAHLTSPRVAPR